MEAKEFLEKQGFSYDHFLKLTSTGISEDIENIIQFAEHYHQAKMKEMELEWLKENDCQDRKS